MKGNESSGLELVPSGTRSALVTVNFIFAAGPGATYNDGYVDNISLSFGTVENTLIRNPGAELGRAVARPRVRLGRRIGCTAPRSPSTSTAAMGRRGAVSAAINGGLAFFAGGQTSPSSTLSQEIQFPQGIRDAIATGGAVADLSAYLGGFGTQNDRADVTLNFWKQAADNVIVGTPLFLPAVTAADRAAADPTETPTLLPREATATIPSEADSR